MAPVGDGATLRSPQLFPDSRKRIGSEAASWYRHRFLLVQQLARLGAPIELKGDTAFVTGVNGLHGAQVMATDLRASVAGLAAQGETMIGRVLSAAPEMHFVVHYFSVIARPLRSTFAISPTCRPESSSTAPF